MRMPVSPLFEIRIEIAGWVRAQNAVTTASKSDGHASLCPPCKFGHRAPYSATTGDLAGPASVRSSMMIMQSMAQVIIAAAAPNT
jgi:hypothetical protein